MIKIASSNIFLSIFLMLISTFNTLSSQEMSGKKVLLLNSYHPEYTWTDDFTKGIESQLKIPLEPEWLYIEYLDGRRMIDNEKYFESLVTFYKYKYANVKFDAIISCDDYALEFLMKHREDVFHGTPVIFGGINDLSKTEKLDYTQYTGVFEGLPVIENLDLIIKVQKDVNKIIILSDKTTQGKQVTATARQLTKGWNNPKVKLEIKDNFSFEGIAQEMKNADKNTAYLILVIINDINGRYFSFPKDLPILSAQSKAPIYGMWGSLLIGNGIVGGYINDPYTHGVEIAGITKQVLKGTKPKDIAPIMQTEYKPRFDYNQMVKFRFNKKLLPKDAIVYFEPESYYKKHKKIIDTATVVFLILIALIFLLFIIIRKQKKHNLELNLLTNELKRSNEHLHQFSYMTSHQLRSSAVNIDMLINYVKEEKPDDIEKKWLWEKIDKASLSIQNTVDDIAKILSIQKQQVNKDLKKVDVKHICSEILLPYKDLINNNKLIVNLNLSEPELYTNENILIEIISTLVENAIKYKPNHKILVLDITTQKANNEIRLSVKDNGEGIPVGFENKIFQIYQRGHDKIEGKGLGLYIAKLLAYSIKVDIEWKNLNKNGVIFTLVFKQ
jgi:ABC-type uncharacterized transport system substrate-binding protein/two-component sensor histidine kinase